MDNYLKCSNCGSVIFEQILPQVFYKNDIRVWGSGSPIPSAHTNIPVLKCLCCNYITIPPCSLVGKNALDTDVKVFKALNDVVSRYNKHIAKTDNQELNKITDAINDIYTILHNKTDAVISNVVKKVRKPKNE